MENIHHFSRSLVARDAPDPLTMDINTAYACLAGTQKHVSVSATEPEHVAALANICHLIAGGEAAFRARPFMTIMVCHVVPPMRFATEACDTLEAAVQAGFPVQIISAGQAGATSPASIAGSLVQAVAETPAGVVFAWLVDPDARIIFAPKPLIADLRTGAMCGGGGEQAVLMAGAAQMGRFYDLPTSSIAGITDAKTADAQSGYEKSLAVKLAAQAGSNLITPLDFGLVGFGYAAALGAQAAAPDRPVISIMGDGGFGFTMTEITSAVTYNLPVIAVVLDNGAWGAEKAYQMEFFGGRLLGAEIDSPPYDKVAELCGALGFAVTCPDQIGAAMAEALSAKRPAVIHVKIDPDALNTLRKDLFAKEDD